MFRKRISIVQLVLGKIVFKEIVGVFFLQDVSKHVAFIHPRCPLQVTFCDNGVAKSIKVRTKISRHLFAAECRKKYGYVSLDYLTKSS